MASRTEDRLFKLLEDSLHQIGRVETKLDDNTKKQASGFRKIDNRIGKVEGRVAVVESKVVDGKVKASDLPTWWKDATLWRWVIILLSIIAAGWFGLDVSGVLK